jgi:hypothetical protein
MSILAPCPTSLHRDPDGSWQLMRQGRPFLIRGAGGSRRFDLLAALGGTTLRTWHTSGSDDLDEAHAHGICVMAGLSVAHERHGFDYSDQYRLKRQREEILEVVRRTKDHPALLLWGLGNEAEGFERPDGNPLVWQELDTLAQLIKAEDPLHPVCVVIAGPGAAKLASFERWCPHVDILGINAYGDAKLVPAALDEAGIDRPFMLTEFGPTGHWESRVTPWGAPIEPFVHDKAHTYLTTHCGILERSAGRCLGTFAFLWGQKQEVTPTWYGMFLPSGEKTATVDAMALAWSGEKPEYPSPIISNLQSPLVEAMAPPLTEYEVIAELSTPSGDSLALEWFVLAESSDRKIGGDPESVPPKIPDCVVWAKASAASIRTPSATGAYRLFLYVRDEHGGGASANFPFFVA